MAIDLIITAHKNIWRCGIARFNARLASELHVPLVSVDEIPRRRWGSPRRIRLAANTGDVLISVSRRELSNSQQAGLLRWARWARRRPRAYEVFWHDYVGTPWERELSEGARRVYSPIKTGGHPKWIRAWCPSAMRPARPVPHLRLLTFGMTHKVNLDAHRKVAGLLDDRPYVVGVSAAVHEGYEWAESYEHATEELRGIYGEAHVQAWGYLADEALAATLTQATACLALGGPARANHTSIWAALNHGCPVVTILDDNSWPFDHDTVLDLGTLTAWPTESTLWRLRTAGSALASQFGWSQLVGIFQ